MTSIVHALTSSRIRTIVIDLAAVAFVYFMPALSHMFALPVYYIEPMRIMVILAIVHTNRLNAYSLALTLPLFSYAIAAHPVFLKSVIISLELVLNVWLFYALNKSVKNSFAAMAVAVVGSKVFYYLLKFGLLQLAMLNGGLFSIPIYFQLVMTIVFSSYLFLVTRHQQKA